MPTELLASAPAAAYLLQHVPLALLNANVDKLVDMANGLALALCAESQVQLTRGSEVGETVDCFDLLLESALSSGALTLDVIKPTAERPHDMRVIAKQVMKMRMSVGVVNKVDNTDSKDEVKPPAGQGLELSDLAKLIAVTSGQARLTTAEEKVAEELAASQARLHRLANDDAGMQTLSDLANVAESGVPDEDILSAFSTAANKHTRIAELLKSSQVKAPRGDESLTNPRALECVTLLRAATNGIVRAAKASLRRLLTPGADVGMLVDAAWAGDMLDTTGVDVSKLARADKDAKWLDLKSSSAKGAAMNQELLTRLLVAQPAVTQALTMLHPSDKTIPMTLAEAFSAVAKGVRSTTVQDAVDCVIVPLMRAYHEAWVLFQKSASMPMPTMKAVWASEKSEPTTASYLTRTGTISIAATASGDGGGENAAAISAIKRELQGLKSKVNGSQTPRPAAGHEKRDEELTAEELAKRNLNREKRERKKLTHARSPPTITE
jgi:hypothetical protein